MILLWFDEEADGFHQWRIPRADQWDIPRADLKSTPQTFVVHFPEEWFAKERTFAGYYGPRPRKSTETVKKAVSWHSFTLMQDAWRVNPNDYNNDDDGGGGGGDSGEAPGMEL